MFDRLLWYNKEGLRRWPGACGFLSALERHGKDMNPILLTELETQCWEEVRQRLKISMKFLCTVKSENHSAKKI